MTNLRQVAQQALEALENLYLTLPPESVLAKSLNHRITDLRTALAQPEQEPVQLTDDVLVPLEILEAAANSLDSFCGNLGWGDADLQTLDNLFAVIEQHKAAHNIKEGT
jgi:hypothetical protein